MIHGLFYKRDRFFLHVLIFTCQYRKRYLHNIKDVYKLYQGRESLFYKKQCAG